MGTKVDYPIRAIDFDAENSILFTGDEMGYIQRWDISILLAKLEEVSRKERKVPYKGPSDILEDGLGILESSSKKNLHESATFVTGIDAGGTAPKAKIEFVTADVVLSYRWGAHTDTINWITYTPELNCLASCSFDCNVYMWKWIPDTEELKGEM